MSFVHFGLLLAFLPLAITPIVLHLLTLHRLRTIELSTYRFLFESHVRQRRRMQFEDILLAILRTLFMLFMVCALSRPIASRWGALFGGTKSGRDVVLLIDASASMNMTTDGVTAMQRAKQAASAVVEHLPKEDRVTILRIAANPREICSRFSADADAIQKNIDDIQAGPSRANWLAAISSLFEGNADRLANPRLYLISDMQATGWRELVGNTGEQVVPGETEMFLIGVGSGTEPENRGIVTGAPTNGRVLAGLPVILRPRIANFSPSERAEVPISLLIDDDEVDTQVVLIPPGESREAEFIYTPQHSGILRARYEIPGDSFSADDNYRFAMTVASEVSVLLINGHPSAEPLDDAALFVRSALTIAQDSGKVSALTAGERQLAKTLQIRESQRARFDADDLERADVVILADCGRLSESQGEALRDYVADGGGLIVLPGEHVDADDYNRALLKPPTSADELAAVRFQEATGSANQPDSTQRLGGIDFGHPIFSVFRNPDEEHLTSTRVHRRFPLATSKSARNTWTLVRLADGSALIAESRFGDGRVLLSAIPFDTSWSNLPLQPEFVPLVLRMVSHVKRRPDARTQPLVAPESVAEIRVDESWDSVAGTVSVAGEEPTPLDFEQTEARFVAGFDGTNREGFYDVRLTGGPWWDPKSETLTFAVNTAAEESNFAALDHAKFDGMFPNAKLRTIDASAEAQQKHGTVGSNREMWRTLILLSLVVIVAEFLLATPSGKRSGASFDMRRLPILNRLSVKKDSRPPRVRTRFRPALKQIIRPSR
jgi:hypothetical protein